MKNVLKLFVAAIFATSIFTTVALADWVQEGADWKYDNRGSFIINDFKQIEGKYYYFDTYGHMVKGVQNIDGEYYIFNQDGTADSDGISVLIEGTIHDFKTTLKGKVVKQDGLDLTIEELNAALTGANDKKAEDAAISAAKMANMAASAALGAPLNGETAGWNKIGNDYRYVGSDGLKFAHKYFTFTFPKQGRNTIYFDDNGNAKALPFVKNGNVVILNIPADWAAYTDTTVTIFGRPCKYDFTTKTISEEDVVALGNTAFKFETYEANLLADFQGLIDKQIADANQKVLEDLQKEQAALEYANRLQLSSTTGAVTNFQVEPENENMKKINVRLNMRVPVFIGNDSDKINAAIAANYQTTVTKMVQTLANELDAACPKNINVPDPTFSYKDNILTLTFYPSVGYGNLTIKYNVATNAWDIK